MRIDKALCAAVLACGLCIAQQGPTPTPEQVESQAAATGVFGKIKEVKAGQRIVIEVEKGKDRTFNLADPKSAVTVAEDLAVGDRVKVVESGKKGNRSVQIVRDVRDNAGEQRSRTQ